MVAGYSWLARLAIGVAHRTPCQGRAISQASRRAKLYVGAIASLTPVMNRHRRVSFCQLFIVPFTNVSTTPHSIDDTEKPQDAFLSQTSRR